MGGELDLVARFPGKRLVRLGGFAQRPRRATATPRAAKTRRKSSKIQPLSPS
jgi:hypothetical protein